MPSPALAGCGRSLHRAPRTSRNLPTAAARADLPHAVTAHAHSDFLLARRRFVNVTVSVLGFGALDTYVVLDTSPPHVVLPTTRGDQGVRLDGPLDAAVRTAAVEAAHDAFQRGCLS
jgi:hypothetical protein